MSAKINLAQQNQAVTLPIAAVFAHRTRMEPTVKSSETRFWPNNHALTSDRFGKVADPTWYNVCVNQMEDTNEVA